MGKGEKKISFPIHDMYEIDRKKNFFEIIKKITKKNVLISKIQST